MRASLPAPPSPPLNSLPVPRQVLTVSSESGELLAFLASLPIINDSFDTKVVYLTSLLELSVIDVLSDERTRVNIETEPAFVALGPNHVAAGMNNQAWFYSIQGAGEAMRVNQASQDLS